MRARAREINIFNMSLLDILCGALGAFCFMMLVLLPYYKPPRSATDLHKQEVQTQDLLRQLEKLRESAKDATLAQQMAETMRKLDEQLKQMHGQLNQLTAVNEQLKAENQDLTARNQKQSGYITMRHPFLTVATANPPDREIDLYLENDNISEEKTRNPPFDPAKPHQGRFWTGDVPWWSADRGVAVWVTRDAPPGIHYKVYVKRVEQPEHRDPRIVNVATSVLGEGLKLNLDNVSLTAERFWELVGTLTVESEGKLTFKAATQPERDAEWTKLSKSSPAPSVQPTASSAPMIIPFSSPAGQPSASPASAEKQSEFDTVVKALGQEQPQSPPVSPSASP